LNNFYRLIKKKIKKSKRKVNLSKNYNKKKIKDYNCNKEKENNKRKLTKQDK